MRPLFFCLLLLHGLQGNASSLRSLYATLDPASVSQHFAFFELYPHTVEGQTALQHAWLLLSGGKKEAVQFDFFLPTLDLRPILNLVNRSQGTDLPVLDARQLAVMEQIGAPLTNRTLQGFGLWDLEEILRLPPEEIDLARGLLVAELGTHEEAKQKIQSYEASLDLMALQVRARLQPHASASEKIRALNDYVFSEMRFRFPPHSLYAKEIDIYTFLPSVLDQRRGVCLGVSILYLSLAQRLNLSLQAVTPPGHIYVRHRMESGEVINIETTARGIDIPTEAYLGMETKELQERTLIECIGLAFMNQAAVSWHKGNFDEAISLYEKARPFLREDYLLNVFLGFNYLFAGREAEGRDLLMKAQTQNPMGLGGAIIEDYFHGNVDAEGIRIVFSEVDEKRSSILEKQEALYKVLERWPNFRQGIFHLAVTWMQLGREKEAAPLLEQYFEMNQNDSTASYYLSAIHFQRYNFNRSWKYLRKAEALTQARGYCPKALIELRRALQRQSPEPI